MTQKEALKQALEQLGGRAQLQEIYPLVLPLIQFKEESDIQATLRTTMKRAPQVFRHSPNKPDGWWELVSYQEEIAVRDKEIEQLRAEVERLKKVPTEDDFVKKLIKATKTLFRFKRNEADAVRQVMDKLGRADADADLTAWMERRESNPAVSIGKLEVRQGGTNIDSNYGPNIEHNGGTLTLPNGFKQTSNDLKHNGIQHQE